MDYLITAHWTAFSGEWPAKEVAGTGSIEFAMTGDVCNLAAAERIAAKNVADKQGYDYRDVAATIDAIVIRPSVTVTLCKPVATVAEPVATVDMPTAFVTLATVMLLISIRKLVEKWIDCNCKKED